MNWQTTKTTPDNSRRKRQNRRICENNSKKPEKTLDTDLAGWYHTKAVRERQFRFSLKIGHRTLITEQYNQSLKILLKSKEDSEDFHLPAAMRDSSE
jgi:hypothetical protein